MITIRLITKEIILLTNIRMSWFQFWISFLSTHRGGGGGGGGGGFDHGSFLFFVTTYHVRMGWGRLKSEIPRNAKPILLGGYINFA